MIVKCCYGKEQMLSCEELQCAPLIKRFMWYSWCSNDLWWLKIKLRSHITVLARLSFLPSVLWRCWLSIRKSIRPVKPRVMRYWCRYLSRPRYRWFAYDLADATATSHLLLY